MKSGPKNHQHVLIFLSELDDTKMIEVYSKKVRLQPFLVSEVNKTTKKGKLSDRQNFKLLSKPRLYFVIKPILSF